MDKANPKTEILRGLNMVADKHIPVKVNKMPL
jgi:hypothetical protein